jgi:hypothetical protein
MQTKYDIKNKMKENNHGLNWKTKKKKKLRRRPKLDKKSNEIKCWETKIEKKKINQEEDKNIEIKRLRTKNILRKQMQYNWKRQN